MDEDGDGDEQTWRPEGPTSEDLEKRELARRERTEIGLNWKLHTSTKGTARFHRRDTERIGANCLKIR